jgi:hypothetical protein
MSESQTTSGEFPPMPENLIDLGAFPQNDVDLITRENLRCTYLTIFDDFIKNYAELDVENIKRENIVKTLASFEHTIAILDGDEEFLEAIHGNVEGDEESEDKEFDRF